MNEPVICDETGSQAPPQISDSLNSGNEATLFPVPNQDVITRGTSGAFVGRDEATSTDTNQECEAPAPRGVTPISDKTRLPKAVVIPQRRPSDRARGFVRAYAPDLLRCGIDQVTFLRFIDGLNKSVASNPAVEAVDLAGEAVGAIPGGEFAGAPILGMGLQVVAGAYKEVNARIGQNGYLTKMNEELFRPRGLHCLIMSYDVKSRSNVVLSGQSDSPSHIIREGLSKSGKMRNHDGILGASNFPEVAELIYPHPADLPESDLQGDGSKVSARSAAWANGQSKIKDRMTAYAEKEDLKSQVKFQKKYPTSLINHLMDPKAELSEKDRQKQEKREAEQQKKEEKREREAEKRAQKYPDKAPKVHEPKEGILYVMIVNMPSIQDVEAARRPVEDPTNESTI